MTTLMSTKEAEKQLDYTATILEEIEEAKEELEIKKGILNDMLQNASVIHNRLIVNQRTQVTKLERQIKHLYALAHQVINGDCD